MKSVSQTTQFYKDIKRMKKRGKDLAKMRQAVTLLAQGKALPLHYRDHALKGQWSGARDCHLEPDWVLIYTAAEDELRLERTGTHSDLF